MPTPLSHMMPWITRHGHTDDIPSHDVTATTSNGSAHNVSAHVSQPPSRNGREPENTCASYRDRGENPSWGRWSWLRIPGAIGVVGMMLIISVAFFLLLPDNSSIMTRIGSVIAAEVVSLIICRRYLCDPVPMIRRIPPKKVALYIGTGIGVFLALILVVALLHVAGVNISGSKTSQDVIGATGVQRVIAMGILVPFVAPAVEELFFRGVVLNMVAGGLPQRRTGTIVAIIVSSFLFAACHAQGFSTATDFFTLGWIFCVGIVMAVIATRRDSVVASYAVHASYNTLTMLVALLVGAQ